ncbi:MAG: glycoside hydrolase family 78 protein [Eubacterium sp.]|nr:glycoside hydrolase family 78 protein [Eubacterium sp.]
MKFQAEWIQPEADMGSICPVFKKEWEIRKKVQRAELFLTALGVYTVRVNESRISDYVLAPGWTAYQKRLQYQQYDITSFLQRENSLTATVGKGWFRSPMPGWFESEDKRRRAKQNCGLWGEIRIFYEDGTQEILPTDSSWQCGESAVRFSEIYDGETYDARFVTEEWKPAKIFSLPAQVLILQEGEEIREMERVFAKAVFQTPKGETVVDFGQEVTGYVEFTVEAKEGEQVRILHGEVLDAGGNFYRENYRSAKAEINYTCRSGKQTWHPALTFFGFRYVKLEQFPGKADPSQFTAITVYSNIRKTGELRCSDAGLNQLFSNIFWGQKGNFLDVPTDCPQRDERLGWTGDAQVFVKAASYNYDVETFFRKWLHDMAADQREDGAIGQVIPDYMPKAKPSAAWGDAAVICPWQIYLCYGNKQVLTEQFACMKRWVDYITRSTKTPYLWTGGEHFGDWLGLDAPSGSFKGSTREELIASAFYAYSTGLLVKAGKAIGEDVTRYEQLYANIVDTFRKAYPTYQTQTEYVLAIQFALTENPQEAADALARRIRQNGCKMETGFVGTPYILHVLSDFGHADLAYSLLLRKEYPSWLYSVGKGATTIWEHWDGIMEDGTFWSTRMNSFNHYAYGAVADWVYEKAAGIQIVEEAPGFERVRIAPSPDSRLEWLEASIQTRHGKIASKWTHTGSSVRYEIETAVPAEIIVDGLKRSLYPGRYTFWGACRTLAGE